MLKKWTTMLALAAGIVLGLAAPAKAQQSVTIRVGFSDPVTTPWGLSLQEFKRIVETESNGRIKVQLYPSEQLGSLVEMIENVRNGAQEISLASPAWFSQFYPKIDMLEMPFLVTNWDEGRRLLSSKAYSDLLDSAEKATGVRIFATFPFGFRNIVNSKRPVTKMDDLKGLKLRVINSPTQLAVWRALGANPVGMAWSEVYQAVQTGVIDGLENTPGVLAANKFPEIAKYLSESRHMYGIMLTYLNVKFFNSLSPADQALVNKAMKAAEEFNLKNVVELEEKSDRDLKGMGAVINKISEENMNAMRKAVQPVYDSLAPKFEPELTAIRKATQP